MLKRKLVFAAAGLLLSLSSAPSLHAQARKWVMPPNLIDFSTSPPTASSLPGSPSTDPYRLANGVFDSSGKLLLYLSQGQQSAKLDVFDSNGSKVDELVSAVNSLQIAVVPVPLSCDLKYYIVYFANAIGGRGPHTPLLLTYSVFDAKLGTIVSKDVQVPPGHLGVSFQLSFGSLAVTPLRSGSTRVLYAVNNNFVDKFLIDSSGISLSNNLVESDAGYLPIQAVLSSDGSKLALGTAGGIVVFTLDSTGDFSGSEVLAVGSPSGLAFSRDGSILFFGDGGGLDYVSLADPLFAVVSLPGSDGYGHSQLQLAVNDKIYAASGDGLSLGAINTTGLIPSFTAEEVPEIFAGNFPGVLTLPTQIDGEPLCGNPALVQSSFGVQGNFEVVVPDSCGGLAHYWRDNDHGAFWYGPNKFGADVGAVDAVSMIQSNYGNLEVVARIGDRLAHFWRGGLEWHGPIFFASGVSGTPSFIQGSLGTFPPGDFELVTPLAAGGLAHYSRNNDSFQQQPWIGPTLFATELGSVTDVSLIQSTLGLAGNNLEVVARIGHRLAHFWRDEVKVWHESGFFASGVSGTPSLIQGNFANPGGPGNFELVTPLAAGGMAHYWRGDDGNWRGPNSFSDGNVLSASLIQSNYGQNFEVVARRDCSLVHYWRTDASAPSPWTWYGTATIIP